MMASERIKRADSSLIPWVVAGVVLAAALGLGAYLFFREAAPPAPEQNKDAFTGYTGVSGPTMDVKLYFPSTGGEYLAAEHREVRLARDVNEQVKLVVEELIRGPVGNLTPSFPAGTRVRSIFLDASGVAYINFSHELQTEFPGGAWTETLTIYSLANTLSDAFPEQIKAVQILVDGHEIPTLAGHVDTSGPFVPRAALNKG